MLTCQMRVSTLPTREFRSRVRRGTIRASLCAEGNANAVPGVDGGQRPREVGQFLFGEMSAYGVVNCIRDVTVLYVRDGLGPFQRGAFAVGVVGGFAPRVQAIEALLTFADGAGVLPMHVDAIRAPVQL